MTTTLSMQTVPRRGTALPMLVFAVVLAFAFTLTVYVVEAAGKDYRVAPLTPPVAEESYRGYTVESFGAGYAVPELELAAASPEGLRLAINSLLFRAATGIVDSKREALYAAADLNRDGVLSSDEAQRSTAKLGSVPGASCEELRLFWGE